MMKVVINIIVVYFIISCSTLDNNIIRVVSYKNLDESLIALNPNIYFSDSDFLFFDTSLKYLNPSIYNSMIDTLDKNGVDDGKWLSNSDPYSAYVFIAYRNNKNNDTLYTNYCMNKWWVIKEKKSD